MGHEIERKFLIAKPTWFELARNKTLIRQGYLSLDPDQTVRIRTETGQPPRICIKGRPVGITIPEIESPVEHTFAQEALIRCGDHVLEKMRYRIQHEGGLTWEIDEFIGNLDGLYLAEIELPDEGTRVDLPDWIGKEVTNDPRYKNAMLVQHGIPPQAENHEH